MSRDLPRITQLAVMAHHLRLPVCLTVAEWYTVCDAEFGGRRAPTSDDLLMGAPVRLIPHNWETIPGGVVRR